MSRQYITVQLTATRKGGVVLLFDKAGKRICVVDDLLCGPMTAESVADKEYMDKWRAWFFAMESSLKHAAARALEDGWDRKCGTWVRSVRMRHNRLESSMAAYDRRKAKWLASHQDWEVVIDRMFAKHARVTSKRNRREKDQWSIWIDTVLSNLKARRKRNGCKDEGSTDTTPAKSFTGVETTQMQFVWRAVDSAKCLA